VELSVANGHFARDQDTLHWVSRAWWFRVGVCGFDKFIKVSRNLFAQYAKPEEMGVWRMRQVVMILSYSE
jgi:hypothetical protein